MESAPIYTGFDDSGWAATLMPNEARARQMYLLALFCLFWAGIVGMGVAYHVGFDLYARSHWRVVSGDIVSYEEKSGHISSRSKDHYWIEFQVEFDPKGAGCNTGSSWAVPMTFSCIGNVKTPSTSSRATAMDWIQRHPPNSPARFLYDPGSGRLRFADESIWNLYPWGGIAAFTGVGTLGVLVFSASRQRIAYLKTLPEGSQEDQPEQAENKRPDEIIDLKLS